MLRLLRITDFAIIESLEVPFGPGLNVLTGETGAGKTIIFDALHLALGGRARTDLIRSGAREAAVETVFELPNTPGGKATCKILNDVGVDAAPGEELIVRRCVSAAGRNRIYLNGVLSTLNLLNDVGGRLVNIHGQHTHQSLLRPATHLGLPDDFAGLEEDRQALGWLVSELREAEHALQKHHAGTRERAQRADLLRFQVEELERAALTPGEMEAMERELPRLRNADALRQLGGSLHDLLYEAEGSVVERLGEALRQIEKMAELDPGLEPLTGEAASVLAQAESLAESLRDSTLQIETDPGRLEALEARRSQLHELFRKYGENTGECLAYLENARAELARLADDEGTGKRIAEEAGRLLSEAAQMAIALSEKRHHAARRLDRKMEENLAELHLRGAVFETCLEFRPDESGAVRVGDKRMRLRRHGIDECEFFFSPNPGEPPRPLARIASGGELSRLMLALEDALRRADLIPTLVFDEVDAGIGGAVAEVVGRKLQEVSRTHQVFVITHLPQVACLGEAHYRIEKRVVRGRTRTFIEPVQGSERVEEIARMGAGLKVTDAARKNAREMLARAKGGNQTARKKQTAAG